MARSPLRMPRKSCFMNPPSRFPNPPALTPHPQRWVKPAGLTRREECGNGARRPLSLPAFPLLSREQRPCRLLVPDQLVDPHVALVGARLPDLLHHGVTACTAVPAYLLSPTPDPIPSRNAFSTGSPLARPPSVHTVMVMKHLPGARSTWLVSGWH